MNKIDTIINLKLNLILKKGDVIKIMAVNTISKGDEGVVGTIAPFLTYVAR